MTEKTNEVPYIVHEGEVARLERTIKKLFIIVVVLVVALFLANAMWLYAWNQYDYDEQAISYEQDGNGANVIGTDNEVTNEPEISY